MYATSKVQSSESIFVYEYTCLSVFRGIFANPSRPGNVREIRY